MFIPHARYNTYAFASQQLTTHVIYYIFLFLVQCIIGKKLYVITVRSNDRSQILLSLVGAENAIREEGYKLDFVFGAGVQFDYIFCYTTR